MTEDRLERGRVVALILDSVADWGELETYDGHTLDPRTRNSMPALLNRALNEAHGNGLPVAAADARLIDAFDDLVTECRMDVRMLKCKAEKAIVAHMDAASGDALCIDRVTAMFAARARMASRFYSLHGEPEEPDTLHYLARIFEGNDRVVQGANKANVLKDADVRDGVLGNTRKNRR